MERADKSRQAIAILLIFVIFAAGCVQTSQTEISGNATVTPTQSATPPLPLPEFDDGLDAALQELEETK